MARKAPCARGEAAPEAKRRSANEALALRSPARLAEVTITLRRRSSRRNRRAEGIAHQDPPATARVAAPSITELPN